MAKVHEDKAQGITMLGALISVAGLIACPLEKVPNTF